MCECVTADAAVDLVREIDRRGRRHQQPDASAAERIVAISFEGFFGTMLHAQSTRVSPLAGGRDLQNRLSRTQPMAHDSAQDPAIYALSGVTAVEEAGTMYFLREHQPVDRVQMASAYDFRPDGLAFGSPLGGLSHPIDNVYHTPSNGLKRGRSYLQRACSTPGMCVVPVNYQPTDPFAASPEGRLAPKDETEIATARRRSHDHQCCTRCCWYLPSRSFLMRPTSVLNLILRRR